MKKLFFTFLILSTVASSVFSQEIKRTLINENLNELFINKDNPYGSIPAKTVDNYFSHTSNIYFFEITYNGKVIFREGIKKSIPRSRDAETMDNNFRFKFDNIYLNASEISDSDKLKLLESYKNKIIDVAGKKIIHLNDYQVIKKDHNKNKYVVINPLENMQVKVYRAEFK